MMCLFSMRVMFQLLHTACFMINYITWVFIMRECVTVFLFPCSIFFYCAVC